MICIEFYLRTKILEYKFENFVHGMIKCYRQGYKMIECEYLIVHRDGN